MNKLWLNTTLEVFLVRMWIAECWKKYVVACARCEENSLVKQQEYRNELQTIPILKYIFRQANFISASFHLIAFAREKNSQMKKKFNHFGGDWISSGQQKESFRYANKNRIM